MKSGLRAAVWVSVLALPAAAMAQKTGVSHPEEVPVTTSPEGIAQPLVWENPAAPPLKERVPAMTAPVVTPPAAVVSSSPAPLKAEERAAVVAEDRMPMRSAVAAPDVDAEIVTRVEGPANELPQGTLFKVRLRELLSTRATAAGTPFTAELAEPVLRDGRVLLPAGSLLNGRVTEVHGGKRVSGSASLHLQPTSVTLPDGTRYGLRAQVIDTGIYRKEKVDSEGTIVRRSNTKGTIAVLALSTGSGAAAGAVFGGWPGALIGAGVSAGVSTVMWLKQDRQTELPAGTELTFGLTGPLAVGTEPVISGTN